MRKLVWTATFLIGAPAVIVWSFLLFVWTSNHVSSSLPAHATVPTVTAPIYAAGDVNLIPEMSASVATGDARIRIIENYLSRYHSPLKPYARHLVETADKYNLDYRLLVAIAQQESNLCKKIPENSFNCWGFGIYGDKVTRFKSYPQGIEIVARALKKNYIDKGLDTPEKIMIKYTPPSVEKGGPWAKGVNQFLSELE